MTEYGSDDYGIHPPVNDDDPLGLLPLCLTQRVIWLS